MKSHGQITPKTLLWVGLLLPLIAVFSSCRLTEQGTSATVFPEDGATNVPVNTVIEIQYPKDLGIKDEQMKYGLFAIRECESNTFSYLTPQKTADPTSTPASTEQKKNADGTVAATPATQTKEQSATDGSQTKYKSEIKFFHSHSSDSTKTVFNYLIVNPEDRATPLKPGTTYCVLTKKLKNDQDVEIKEQETQFTTEETPSLEFDTKIDVEFFGDRLTSGVKDKGGNKLRDFILLNLRGQAVKPTQLKGQIKLCLEETEKTTSSEACKDFGKEVPSDIYLIESLQNDSNQRVLSHYGLYGVTPRQAPTPGQKYKVVVNLDIAKNEDTNVGMDESNPIEVDEEANLHWMELFKSDVKDGNGNSIYSDKTQFFYVGSGS